MLYLLYFLGLIITFSAYFIGAKTAKSVPEELKKINYLIIFRDICILFVLAIIPFSYNKIILQYSIPLLSIILYPWISKYLEKIYPYLIPILLFLTTKNTFITNTVLLTITNFIDGGINYKKLYNKTDDKKYKKIVDKKHKKTNDKKYNSLMIKERIPLLVIGILIMIITLVINYFL